jgi:hypothetical protein
MQFKRHLNEPSWLDLALWVPVWLLTKLMVPFFRQDHPWKGKKLTLRSWCERGTKAALEFSCTFWLIAIIAALTGLILFLRAKS